MKMGVFEELVQEGRKHWENGLIFRGWTLAFILFLALVGIVNIPLVVWVLFFIVWLLFRPDGGLLR